MNYACGVRLIRLISKNRALAAAVHLSGKRGVVLGALSGSPNLDRVGIAGRTNHDPSVKGAPRRAQLQTSAEPDHRVATMTPRPPSTPNALAVVDDHGGGGKSPTR